MHVKIFTLYIYILYLYIIETLYVLFVKKKKHRILQVCSRFSLALFVNLREFTQKVKSGRD